MYKIDYKFNGENKSYKFDSYTTFEDYMDSIPATEQKHIIDNCDLLHQAIARDKLFEAMDLLKRGCNHNKPNKDGITAIQFAQNLKKKNIISLFMHPMDPVVSAVNRMDPIAEEDPQAVTHPTRMSALSVSSHESWVEREEARRQPQDKKGCCIVM